MKTETLSPYDIFLGDLHIFMDSTFDVERFLLISQFYFGNFQSTIGITSKVFLERGIERGAKFTVYVLGMVLETSPLT